MTQPMPTAKRDHTVLCVQTGRFGDAKALLEPFIYKDCREISNALKKLREYRADALVVYVTTPADYYEIVRIRELYPDLPILAVKDATTERYKFDFQFHYLDLPTDMSTKELAAEFEKAMRVAYRLVGAL